VEGTKNLIMMSYTREAWALLSIGEKETLNLSNYWIKLPQSESRFIMHRLGNYKLPNTLSGARSSVLRSASLFEVDIFWTLLISYAVTMVLSLLVHTLAAIAR